MNIWICVDGKKQLIIFVRLISQTLKYLESHLKIEKIYELK